MPDATKANGSPARFGTFGGVFTPCTLTILGVIMFLRFGEVVGQAGIWSALAIVAISKVITTLTALSLSAIATNTRVKGGGAYFLISRSLGVEFGGAIGVVFFIAQAVSVAMYVIGFTEALLGTFPGVGLDMRTVGTLVNVAVFICVYIGAGWTIKVQYGILAVLGLALVSFGVGAAGAFSTETFTANLAADYGPKAGFFAMFALFFPAATGIMAGANMSGDLKDPGRAIPKGTLTSIAVTGVIYLAMAALLGGSAGRDALKTDNLVVKGVSWVPLFITLGVFAATLSSALGSMMGAPRILQALARDEVFNRLRPFALGSGRNQEPRRAVILTFGFAQAGILVGDLNTIAPVITMFFMITYGLLNLATFYESITRNPSYRPTFRWSHWSTELLGAAGCTAAMFLISPLWAVVSVAALGALHYYIRRREISVTWGDVKSGAAFERARKALLRLEEEKYHPKNWRPSVLALSGGAWTRNHLAIHGHWLTAGRGLLTLGQIIPGETEVHIRRRANQESALRAFLREQQLKAFPAVLVAPSLELGIEALVQCSGVGALRPNVVLLGWSADVERAERFGALLRNVAELERSLVLLNYREYADDPWLVARGPVDVWWRGKANGNLMLLLAHLLVQNDTWRGRPLRLLRVSPNEAGKEEATQHLREFITEARIDAEPVVVVDGNPQEAIHRTSAGSAAVLLGFQPPVEGEEKTFQANMDSFMDSLGSVILVWSAGETALEA